MSKVVTITGNILGVQRLCGFGLEDDGWITSSYAQDLFLALLTINITPGDVQGTI